MSSWVAGCRPCKQWHRSKPPSTSSPITVCATEGWQPARPAGSCKRGRGATRSSCGHSAWHTPAAGLQSGPWMHRGALSRLLHLEVSKPIVDLSLLLLLKLEEIESGVVNLLCDCFLNYDALTYCVKPALKRSLMSKAMSSKDGYRMLSSVLSPHIHHDIVEGKTS